MKRAYDVVVIGSGFGGSITACRLAQAGRSVCVLERGRRWQTVDFPRSPGEIARNAFWDPERARFGLIEYRAFRGMHVLQGSGVGGGSLHYFNVHIRPPASIFADERWPPGVDRESLAPYYALAEDMLEAAPLTPPPGRALPSRTLAFEEACRRIGHEPERVPIAVYTGPARLHPETAIPQAPCDYVGNCAIGCVPGAKNTLDRNYLAVAEAAGAEVHPLHEVAQIEPRRRGGYKLSFDRRHPTTPTLSERGQVDARTVIVAAGTLGSIELLLRCRDRYGTLPRLSPTLGRGFSSNGDFLLAGTLTDDDIDAGRGPSITAGADFASSRQELFVEDLGFPDPLLWFIEGMLANAVPTKNVLRWGKLFLQGRFGIEGATDRLSHERERLFGGGRTRGFLPYLAMCEDAADGECVLDEDGRLDLRWSPERSMKHFLELEDALRALSEALDGDYVPNPLWTPPVRELLTAHPLGGCAMADGPDRGVVDDRCEVHGHPGLYVVDASIVPTSLARNPTATISALAERAAHRMVHERDLGPDEEAAPAPFAAPTAVPTA